jgi:hypothetical protein
VKALILHLPIEDESGLRILNFLSFPPVGGGSGIQMLQSARMVIAAEELHFTRRQLVAGLLVVVLR